jgi:hypothetical protein
MDAVVARVLHAALLRDSRRLTGRPPPVPIIAVR